MTSLRHKIFSTLMATSVTAAAAQGRVGCVTGAPEASFGIADLDCVQCTIHSGAGATWIEYGAEPTIKRVASGGDGLRPGDAIVSIDGALITTTAGARRFASPAPGRTAIITVRRDGRQLKLGITPTLSCHFGVAGTGHIVGDSIAWSTDRAYPVDSALIRGSIGGAGVARGGFAAGSGGGAGFARGGFGAGSGGGAGGGTGVGRSAVTDSVLRGGGTVRFRINYDSNGNRITSVVPVDSANGALRDRLAARGGAAAYLDGSINGGAPPTAIRRSARGDSVFYIDGTSPSRAGSLTPGRISAGTFVADTVRTADGSPVRYSFGRGTRIPAGADSASFSRGFRDGTSASGGFAGAPTARGGAAGGRGIAAMPSVNANVGWLGFGLECKDCSVRNSPDGRRLWKFSEAPAVAGVEPASPAELAGIEVGDILRGIDGMNMTSPDGAERFSSVHPGQRVRLIIERNGKRREVVMVAKVRAVRT